MDANNAEGFRFIPVRSVFLLDPVFQDGRNSPVTPADGATQVPGIVVSGVSVILSGSLGSCRVQRGDQQTVKVHKTLQRIAGYVTNWEDIVTLGLALHSDPHDVRRLRNQSHGVKDAAYDVMSAFYDRCSDITEMWGTLIQALGELGLNKAVVDLGLDRLMRESRAETRVKVRSRVRVNSASYINDVLKKSTSKLIYCNS